jgi:hypothetical protein
MLDPRLPASVSRGSGTKSRSQCGRLNTTPSRTRWCASDQGGLLAIGRLAPMDRPACGTPIGPESSQRNRIKVCSVRLSGALYSTVGECKALHRPRDDLSEGSVRAPDHSARHPIDSVREVCVWAVPDASFVLFYLQNRRVRCNPLQFLLTCLPRSVHRADRRRDPPVRGPRERRSLRDRGTG